MGVFQDTLVILSVAFCVSAVIRNLCLDGRFGNEVKSLLFSFGEVESVPRGFGLILY